MTNPLESRISDAVRILRGETDNSPERRSIETIRQEVRESCQCEHIAHFPDEPGPISPFRSTPPFHPYLGVPAGNVTAMYVGRICDECAEIHMAPFIS